MLWLAAATVMLVACTDDDASDGEVSAPVATDDDENTTDGENGSDPVVDEPDPEPEGPNGRLQLGGFVEQHSGSVALTLTSVEVDPNGDLLVGFEAVNRGRGRNATSIAEFGVRATDDLGNVYAFEAPADNDRLRFEGDERMTGTLVFRGPVDPDAERLEVGFNQQGDEAIFAADHAPSQYAKFLFQGVPLPGIGLEDEAGEGAGGSLIDSSTVDVGITVESDEDPGYEVTVVDYVEDGQTVTMSLEVANGSSRMVALALDMPRLEDDQGSTLRYVRPDDVEPRTPESRIELDPGDEASVQLAFRGTISGEATELELRTIPVTVSGIPVPSDD